MEPFGACRRQASEDIEFFWSAYAESCNGFGNLFPFLAIHPDSIQLYSSAHIVTLREAGGAQRWSSAPAGRRGSRATLKLKSNLNLIYVAAERVVFPNEKQITTAVRALATSTTVMESWPLGAQVPH